jgi:hypothetical protein
VGLPTPSLLASRRPARPANSEHMTWAAISGGRVRTPDRRATSGSPPTAKRCAPVRVRDSRNHTTAASASMMMVETGTGPTPVAPMSWNSHGTAPALPWKLVLRTPCRMRPTPSVAMKPFTFSTVTISPLARPMAAHTSRVSVTAHGMLAGFPAIVVAPMRLARLMT